MFIYLVLHFFLSVPFFLLEMYCKFCLNKDIWEKKFGRQPQILTSEAVIDRSSRVFYGLI